MLELRDLCYAVDAPEGATEILKGISLTIPDKKLVVFTGPNGGGKTTLAKAIMGLVQPTSGAILWNGQDITGLSITERARLGMAGKLGGAFATEQYTHGGAEMVIQSILTNEIVFGMLCYSGGSAWGRPIIHMGPVGVNGNTEPHNGMEHYRDNFVIFGERFASKAKELFG